MIDLAKYVGTNLKLGTRASSLALWQANWIKARLQRLQINVEQVLISTAGDREQKGPVSSFGGQGVFTKEIQNALLDGRIDLAVHSLKDLPTDFVSGLKLGAVPERGPTEDVLVSANGDLFIDLPKGATMGTGSIRRRAHLLHARADLKMESIRGNVETRLKKLASGKFDAIVLARAGLVRLGLEQHITEPFSTSVMLPAVGQGALGVECRDGDQKTVEILAAINDDRTHRAVTAERRLLSDLCGGCLAPIGALAEFDSDGRLHLSACVLSHDGRQRISFEGDSTSAEISLEDAAALGARAAVHLIEQGAEQLLNASRDAG